MEIKVIEEFPSYSITKNGEILSLYEKGRRGVTGKILRRIKTSIGTNGYETVSLYKNGKRSTLMVHRLMAKTFLELKEDRNVVNHKDSNKNNNNISNLEWCSQIENYNHAFVKNRMVKPPIKRFIDDIQVMTIRTINNPLMDKVFAELYKVDKSSICRIRNNKTYTW